jgi:hypothetical protein
MEKNEIVRKTNDEAHRAPSTFDGARDFKQVLPIMPLKDQWPGCAHSKAEQVIIQVWISSHFEVLSKRLLAADESFGFIKAIFTPARLSVKADLGSEARGLLKTARLPSKVVNRFFQKKWKGRSYNCDIPDPSRFQP